MVERTAKLHFIHSFSLRTLFRLSSIAACLLCLSFLVANTLYLKDFDQSRDLTLNYTAVASSHAAIIEEELQLPIKVTVNTPNKSSIITKEKQSTKKQNAYPKLEGEKPQLSTKSLPFRLCSIKIDPGQKNLTVIHPIMVQYQCAGSAYDEFSHKLLELATTPKHFGLERDSKNWGKRKIPTPANSTVVFLGNSHTRQVFQTFMCQYRDNIVKATVLNDVDGKGSGIVHVSLKENITVYGVTNLPHVYSPRWSELLKVSMNLQTLNDIDALVLGHFNTFKESINSTFMTLMKNLTAGTDADFERISPPGIEDVAKVYSGPIIAVSMFADYDVRRHKGVLKQIGALRKKGRKNIFSIDGRQYVPYIGECASDLGMSIGTCLTTDKSPGKRHINGHRCVGKNGGHPDLISWDIIELFHRVVTH
jgi:hypothetical protein